MACKWVELVLKSMTMKIETQHIPSQGMTLVFEKKADAFPVLKKLIEKGEIALPEPIVFEINVIPERDMIKIKGSLAAAARLACSRCLAVFETTLRQRFTLRFSRQIPQDVHPAENAEIELTAEQIGLVFYKGEEIDLSDALQEQVVLALPYKPLCRADCKGLCPYCGTDLNHGDCQCRGDQPISPFAVLKGLKIGNS